MTTMWRVAWREPQTTSNPRLAFVDHPKRRQARRHLQQLAERGVEGIDYRVRVEVAS